MNIFIDSLNNMIHIGAPGTKKTKPFYFSMEFEYPLSTVDNQIKAVHEFLQAEEAGILAKQKSNSLILPDLSIGFGSFEFPALSKFKMKDVFDTRFKVCFPNYASLNVVRYEYDRSSKNAVWFFTIVKKEVIEKFTQAFKEEKVSVKSFDFYAHHVVANVEDKDPYPIATLIIGANDSELLVTKGSQVNSVSSFGYGSEDLLNGTEFFDSAYSHDNERARRYSGLAKEIFSHRVDMTDENIAITDPKNGISFARPREIRVLKGDVLETYTIKNNFRKFISRVIDVAFSYSVAPWFMPLTEIKVVCSEEVFQHLAVITEERAGVTLVKSDFELGEFLVREVKHNSLFSGTGIAKERRKIDWAKFFSMEIGKKKKG